MRMHVQCVNATNASAPILHTVIGLVIDNDLECPAVDALWVASPYDPSVRMDDRPPGWRRRIILPLSQYVYQSKEAGNTN